MDCLFCRIGRRELPSVVLAEHEDILMFLDICPIRLGHAQIIPKQHYESFELLPPELAAKMIGLGQRLAQRMKALYRVERVAFVFTGGDVPHAHAHVLPMHEKSDITSARFALGPMPPLGSQHLRAGRDELERVRDEIDFR